MINMQLHTLQNASLLADGDHRVSKTASTEAILLTQCHALMRAGADNGGAVAVSLCVGLWY
jgi:hypothetical protein